MANKLIIVFFAFIVSIVEAQETLKYDLSGSSNWVPYYLDNKKAPGIIGELIPLILTKADIKGQQITLPPKRTNLALQKGLLDFDITSPSWFANDQVDNAFILSLPIMPVRELVYVLDDQIAHERFNPNKNVIVGTVRGYFYHNDNKFTRDDFPSEKELVLALATNRIEYAIIGDLPAEYWASKFNIALKVNTEHSSGFLHVRLHKKYQHLIANINAAITELKDNGTIEKVVSSYMQAYVNE